MTNETTDEMSDIEQEDAVEREEDAVEEEEAVSEEEAVAEAEESAEAAEQADEETVDEEEPEKEGVDSRPTPRKVDGGQWEIECSKCDKLDTIPFEPYEDAAVYCRRCYERDKRQRQKRERSSPRKQHGTRVSFNIVCSECGSEAELDYVPKGISMDEMQCPDCFEDETESGRWKQVRDVKKKEQTSEWSFDCAKCGRTDWLNFEPNRHKDYLCTRCFYRQADPKHERLEDKQSVGPGVFIRKSKSDD
jgi:CxxC-x17-CxxC domain-containing protein